MADPYAIDGLSPSSRNLRRAQALNQNNFLSAIGHFTCFKLHSDHDDDGDGDGDDDDDDDDGGAADDDDDDDL